MFPAQALAEEMLRRGWRVVLSTDERGLRYAGGFPDAVKRVSLSAATFARGGIAAKLVAPFRILKGVWEAWRWFGRDRPACVIGFGGYPALPALAGAWLRNCPRAIHEQNGVLGRVNRLFAKRVHRVACGTWPVSRAPEGAALVDIGNPVRSAALEAAETPYAPPTEDGRIELLVFGGSQGASVFSKLVPEGLARLEEGLRRRIHVTHQARENDQQLLAKLYEGMGLARTVQPFFTDMPRRIAAAHCVVCRAGASTVAELAVIGRPAVLVPLPTAMDDHQTANAEALAATGGAILAPQAELTAEGLSVHLAAILTDPARAAEMAASARQAARPRATTALADMVGEIAGARAATEGLRQP